MVVRKTAADPLAFLGAAYSMIGTAHVVLGREGKIRTATLLPRAGAGAKGLAEAFEKEYLNQVRRWALAREHRAARRESLARQIALAKSLGDYGQNLMAALPPERKAEIDALLAEAEGEPWDPLGIAQHWSDARK